MESIRAIGRPWVRSGIWLSQQEPYWPAQCVRLWTMVCAREPAARIVAMAEWIAAGYAGRRAHDAVAADHNAERVGLLTAVARQFRVEGQAGHRGR